jgi:hypothetical protein
METCIHRNQHHVQNTEVIMRSNWHVHDRDHEHKIVYIVDENRGMSVTNDAENVLVYFTNTLGSDWRVIYKDTDGEWWEMDWGAGWGPGEWRVVFKPWRGLVLDILSRDFK